MTQSRRQSAIEAITNTALAFLLSWLSHVYLVSPLLVQWHDGGGDITSWAVGLLTTIYYTALSLARNYAVRRWWNGKEQEND